MTGDGQSIRAALCISHPGHELRVLRWMELNQPIVAVFTDGSGSNRPPRIDSTTRLIEEAGAGKSRVYAPFSDRQFYELILRGDPAPFIEVAGTLVDEWIEQKINFVAGDMMEGFNSTHDLCRIIIDAAMERCRCRHQRALANYDFPLESLQPPPAQDLIVIELNDEAFARKREVAMEIYPELASEVARTVAKYGEAPFRKEYLRAAPPPSMSAWARDEPPFYETYGKKQIELGHYRELITFEGHLRPLAQALGDWATRPA